MRRHDNSRMLLLWPGGKDLPGKKHRPGWPFSRNLWPASAGWGGLIGRPAGRPYPERILSMGRPEGWPSWSMKWKPPH